MRRAERRDGGEAIEAADAMVAVHDEIADAQAGRLGDDVGGPARLAPGAHQPVAQDVLLADHGQIGRLEALLDAEHRERGRVGRQRVGLREALDLARIGQLMLAEQRQQALARARRERGDDHPLALGLQVAHVLDGGGEHVAAFAGALEREVAPHPAAEGEHPALLAVGSFAANRSPNGEPGFGCSLPFVRGRAVLGLAGRNVDASSNGVMWRTLRSGLTLAPLLARQEHGGRRHGLVGRRAEGERLQPLHPRLVVVGDQGEPLLHRLLGQVVEADGRVADVVEQRLQVIVEQRQPVLHAGIALSGADGLVERVLGRGRAERLQVVAAKALLGLLAERHLADRHQGELLHDLARALRLGIEGLDVLQRVAEEVEAHGRQPPRREQVEDAAAHGVFARLP